MFPIHLVTWETLVVVWHCWMIWTWWSDDSHFIVEESGDDILGDIGVHTHRENLV